MTYVAPTTMPTVVERADWSKFARDTVRTFFTRYGADEEIDTAVMMLVPASDSLPFVALVDEYEDEETLAGVERLVRENARGQIPVANSEGDMVVLFPVFFKDDTHKRRTVALLKGIADVLGAKATAVVSECWLRGVDGPRGTGQESLMLLLEEQGRAASSFVARIHDSMPDRSLGVWRAMPGTPDGLLCGFLDKPQEESLAAREGFTAKINVSTVGEA